MRRRVTHLICDLDNTLYDWVGYFVPSFYAMVNAIIDIVPYDREELLEDFRKVHLKHHDSEHAFAVLDTDFVRNHFVGQSRAEIAEQLDSAFHAFNRTRKQRLQTYPNVHSTLTTLKSGGVRLIAHSEAKFHSIVDRLSRLELFPFFDTIYCRERSRSSHPDPSAVRRVSLQADLDKIVELSHHQRKPSAEVLAEICARENAIPSAAAYVGDSMTKDIMMAKRSGLFAIWAKYGTKVEPEVYERLVRISHWTTQEVEEERALRLQAASVQPDVVLEHGFNEVLNLLEFGGMPNLRASA